MQSEGSDNDMGSEARYYHPANARRTLVDGPFSAVLLMASSASGGKLSLVEHPFAPRALGSPMHTHSHEDEFSYVLAGQIFEHLASRSVTGPQALAVVGLGRGV